MLSLPKTVQNRSFCVGAASCLLLTLSVGAHGQTPTTFNTPGSVVNPSVTDENIERDGVIIDNVDLTVLPDNSPTEPIAGQINNGVVFIGNATLTNQGVVTGNILNTTSLAGGPHGITFNNENNFFGNLFLSGNPALGGDDTVRLTAGSVFNGSIFSSVASRFNLGSGDDVIILDGDGSVLAEDPFLNTDFTRDIEELRVEGDSLWIISGNGTLELDNGFTVTDNATAQYFIGDLVGDVTIDSNGRLETAFVSVDGNLTNNASLLTDRSSFPLSVTGNLVNSGTSDTAVTVDPRGSAGTIEVDGTATIGAGATLAVRETLEVFPNTVTFTVLSADGGITGAGNYATVTNDFPFLTSTLDTSDPNNITVTLTRNGTGFSGVAETDNQRNVGFIWEVAGAAAGPGTDALAIDGVLNTLTDPQLRSAFTSMSGESQTAAPRVATQASRGFGRGLERRSRMMHVVLAQGDILPSPRLASSGGLTHDLSLLSAAALAQPGRINSFDTFAPGFWVDVLGGEGDIDGDASFAGVDYDYYGLVGGFDIAVSNEWIVGVSAGYTTGSYDVSDFSADGDLDTLNLAFYTALIQNQWRFNASIGYAFDSYDTNRVVSVPTLGDRIASADYDGGTFSIDGTATYRYDLKDDFKLEPFGTVEYFRSRTDDYAESGAGALNLFVSEGNYEALYTTLGARLFKTFQLDSAMLTPEVRGGWQHEWLDHDAQFDARFLAAGVGAPIRVTGAEADDDAALLGVGLTADFNRKFSLRFDYDSRIGSNQTDQQFTLALRVPW